MRKGIKICQSCGIENGVRAYECKNCDAPFEMRKKRRGVRKKDVSDWTTLKRGDVIRVVGRSGPYFENEFGDRTYLLSNTLYKIYKLTDDGIVAHGKYGFEFIYCGKEKRGLVSSITQAPAKLKLVMGNTDPLVARRKRNKLRRG
jgi:ribosomal protein L40E